MTVRAHRFRFEVGGKVRAGLLFDDDRALDEFLLDRRVLIVTAGAGGSASAPAVGKVGRPSCRQLVAAARSAMIEADFEGCETATDVARRVADRIAEIYGRRLGLRTVRDHLRPAAMEKNRARIRRPLGCASGGGQQ